ncbi:hypothetical protein [Plantactinospora alkalitolerans]|uniref:hypothetical protein n=1 Tax=Plantactinospora alkalitolerans TaxID=2789879 RepID=UPI001E508A61|nr:hypothetical protein [Plantactinospora alkalitolerans]
MEQQAEAYSGRSAPAGASSVHDLQVGFVRSLNIVVCGQLVSGSESDEAGVPVVWGPELGSGQFLREAPDQEFKKGRSSKIVVKLFVWFDEIEKTDCVGAL